MTCPVWCVHHGTDNHPAIDGYEDGCAGPTVEHVRAVSTPPLASGPALSVDLIEIVGPASVSGALRRIEGPGISLIGLSEAVAAGQVLTAADARALARALERAARRLDADPDRLADVLQLRAT